MNETPDPASVATGAPETQSTGFFDSIRRLGIPRTDDRWIGGVGAGVAHRLGIDPLIVRAVLTASILLGGLGLLLYGLAWAFLPEARDGRIHAQELFRGNPDVALLGAGGFAFLGLIAGDWWMPWSWWGFPGHGWFQGLLWLALIGVVIALVVSSTRNSQTTPPPTTTAGSPSPVPAPSPTTAAATAGASDSPRPNSPQEETMTTQILPPDTGAPEATAPDQTPPPGAGGPPTAYYTGPQYAPPPPPPTPRVPSAGSRMWGVAAGLSVLSYAALLLASRVGTYDGPVLLTAVGVSVVVFGLAIVIAGLRGRTSGGLGATAIVLVLVSLPLGVLNYVGNGWVRSANHAGAVSNAVFAPTTVDQAQQGFTAGAGNATIDLTGLDLTGADTPIDVSVNHGAGDLTVQVPEELAARIEVSVGFGSANWRLSSESGENSGIGVNETLYTEAADAGAPLDLEVSISVGFGQATIVEVD